MAFFSSALILDGAAGFSAKAVPVPSASEISIAATTDDFINMFSSRFLLPKGLEAHHWGGNRKEQWGFVSLKASYAPSRSPHERSEMRERPRDPNADRVVAGLVPAMHVFELSCVKSWMPGIKPGMTWEGSVIAESGLASGEADPGFRCRSIRVTLASEEQQFSLSRRK